jgi:uncharacterized damage-inducible protein DinB
MKHIVEALRQVRDGEDFTAPASVLKISAKRAVVRKEGWPYSIADNVAHCELWQRVWLSKLQGQERPKFDPKIWDWPKVPEEQWTEVRRRFLEGLDEAIALTSAEPFSHKMASDEGAAKVLLEIAVHDAYHVGQWVVLKRLLVSA